MLNRGKLKHIANIFLQCNPDDISDISLPEARQQFYLYNPYPLPRIGPTPLKTKAIPYVKKDINRTNSPIISPRRSTPTHTKSHQHFSPLFR